MTTDHTPPADQTAVLTAAERQFLRFALDLAADEMASRGDEFTTDDEAALARLRRMADETQPTQPWPSVTDYALEVWEMDEWVGITHRRKTLDDARERRESYRRRFPGRRFRIVRWTETSTVVECDPEPAAEPRQDGTAP